MRWLVCCALFSGCAFEVPAVSGLLPGNDPQANVPDDPARPPAAMPPELIDPGSVSTNDLSAAADLATPPDLGKATRSSNIGDSCDDAKDPCAAEQVCERKNTLLGPDIPGGYCSLDCRMATCPTGSVCSTTFGTTRLCLQVCPAGGCRTGYACCTKGYSSPGVCLPSTLCQ